MIGGPDPYPPLVVGGPAPSVGGTTVTIGGTPLVGDIDYYARMVALGEDDPFLGDVLRTLRIGPRSPVGAGFSSIPSGVSMANVGGYIGAVGLHGTNWGGIAHWNRFTQSTDWGSS